ncbi:MAG: dTMP kinase [Nanoarchaeota archaeon]|nr:dTMP kinase [Nanoarchaeota archaeon]MCG2718205.1 dTMP kinase [Nanoarchaeota archaeon]
MNYKLILIEGIDGSGKGVIARTFKELAKEANLKIFDLKSYIKENKDFPEYDSIKDYDVILSAEPTYGWIGQAIRDELIRDNNRKYSALAVAHAYALDRKILYKRLLIKALEEGKIVMADRSVVSSIIYQPLQAKEQGEELGLDDVLKLPGNKLAVEEYPPSLLIIAKLDPEKAIQRLESREKKDDCIFEKLEFQKKLQERYNSKWLKRLFEKRGTKVVYIDVNKTVEDSVRQTKEIWNEYIKGD